MTISQRFRCLAMALLLLLALSTGSVLAEDEAQPAWMDLDGDGLNDLAEDADQDGIPDFGVRHDESEAAGPAKSGIFANMEMPKASTRVTIEPNSLRFDKLSKLTMAQCMTRCDLESAFGGGLGSGTQGAGGGACAGGICLR